MKNNIYKMLLLTLVVGVLFSSCRKWLEVKPEGVQLEEEAIKSPEDLQRLLNSCYDASANIFNGRVQQINELLGDDVNKPAVDADGFVTAVYNRQTNFFNSTTNDIYLSLNRIIFRVNFVNSKINDIAGVTEDMKTRLTAEGSFIRALCHFELVKMYAQPYGYTGDNSHLGIVIRDKSEVSAKARSTVKEVYNFIISDLKTAVSTLPENNGLYVDKNGAKALLAKVYFQMNDFANAALYAGEVIKSGRYSVDSVQNRFANASMSTESIFSFVSTSNNDNRSKSFIDQYRCDNNPNPNMTVTKYVYSLVDKDTSDIRLLNFQPLTSGPIAVTIFNRDWGSVPFIHYTDILLLHAEALAELGTDLSTAAAEVNSIKHRAYKGNSRDVSSTATATEIRDAARFERHLEMLCQGDRVQQLKRMGAKGEPIKVRNAPWNCDGLAIQFPVNEKTTIFVFNPEGGCN
ncbi:MAG: RagB/SusD family nutrient uptake outer membrane protein [Bacteroidetes bacterium]|nr:RagB/SusD family nutrient uptake outer membrane protein [Bacteroidota bacterium]